jgi:AmmeMemoRadiSam system protein A
MVKYIVTLKSMELSQKDKQTLLSLAMESVEYGVTEGSVMEVRAKDYSEALRQERATFVTIKRKGKLRGCIGMIDPIRPLVVDVVHNAHSAAFRDPRFSPLERKELERLELYISILSLRESMSFYSEEDLLSQMRPGVDGLVLEDNFYCGAFLPVMWDQIPDREEFLKNLKRKAGLPSDYWSDSLRVSRFTSEYYLSTSRDEQNS